MKFSRSLSIILLIVANIAIDQASKIVVRANIEPRTETSYGEVINVIGDAFINDSLRVLLLLILPVVVLGFVLYYIFKNKSLDRLSLIGFCFIIGGGIANVFDRIVYGSVTDFFHIDLGGGIRTGIFNVADMSVTSGMIMLVIASFIHRKKETNS